MAFCAIIHKHRPDLIDFESLSKDNVYDNNRLAFETAESELGIPALLDPEDMVSMKVPDRLSIITYVSQFYNFFTNNSQANPVPSERPSGTVQIKFSTRRLVTTGNDQVMESKERGGDQSKRETLSSTCAACQKHVHLVQRHLVDGKLYHRNCFRCRECSSTLLPGSYKVGSEAGFLVCTHHVANHSSRPDLSNHHGDRGRPVPAPRRACNPPSAPRPTPRSRPSKVTDSPTANGDSDGSSKTSWFPKKNLSPQGVPASPVEPANPGILPASVGSPGPKTVGPSNTAGPGSPKSKRRPAPGVPLHSPTVPSQSLAPCLSPVRYQHPAPTLKWVTLPHHCPHLRVRGLVRRTPSIKKAPPTNSSPKPKPRASEDSSRPTRPPAPGHGFPLIKRKVQTDEFIPVEDIQMEMAELERRLDQLELRGVELEKSLRDCQNDEEEETLLVDWFTLIHEKHMMVRREAELVYTAKQQNLEERQADVEYELRCLLNKPEREWIEDDRDREQQLMVELVAIIEERNHIINSMDQDKQREEVEDKLLAAMIKRKDFQRDSQKRRGAKFKPMKVLKMLSQKAEGNKSKVPLKSKS
ncbi:hypothetical protein AGOR_G00227760 [Albula goreensis]|uniref:MICAL-like protein 1 n=1 Tax=Albula goreensis TaxID=1534307 RepID=A0A8T3CKT7_9TELE|nr:hypothetical protein AGOR_G00227760 [Albula goreensis]